jgi:hypothetical protein
MILPLVVPPRVTSTIYLWINALHSMEMWRAEKYAQEGFSARTTNQPLEVNNSPSLASLDASESIIDPDKRRQCNSKFKTLCCDGGTTLLYVIGCYEC